MAQYNFQYTGSLQQYTVPSDGSVTTIKVTVAGASGGAAGQGAGGGGSGANGGIITGNILVTPGQTYYIVVGGSGANGITTTQNGYSGGSGGGGGGKSMITTTINTTGIDSGTLIVGGGGGGGGGTQPFDTVPNGAGGVGGWPSGGSGGYCGNSGPGSGGGGDGYWGGYGGSNGPSNTVAGTQTGGYQQGVGGPGTSEAYGYSTGSGDFAGWGGYVDGGAGGNGYSIGNPGRASGGAGGSSYIASSVNYLSSSSNNSGNGYVTIDEIGPINLPVTSDIETGLDFIITSGPIKAINVSDIEFPILDYTGLARQRFSVDLPIQVATSNYKWLTSTLLSAEQSFTVRPYVKCQIVDQTLIVNQQIINNPSTQHTGIGTSIQAPDGTILTIATDVNGNLRFGQITDGTQTSQWQNIRNGTSGTIIATSGTWNYYNNNFGAYAGFELTPDIECSDFINNSYIVDVYYWYNNGTNWIIKQVRTSSGSGFLLWTTNIVNTDNLIPSSTTYFFQLGAGKPIYDTVSSETSAMVFCLIGGIQSNPSANNFGYYYSTGGDYLGTSEGDMTSWIDGLSLSGNNQDWQLHSFDAIWIENNNPTTSTIGAPPTGVYHIIFSGYHTTYQSTNSNLINPMIPTQGTSPSSATNNNVFYGNFGLYQTRLLTVVPPSQTGLASPIWDEPREVLTFNSSSSQNWNQAIYPSLSYDGNSLWLTFRMDTTQSIDSLGTVTNISNYYLSQSTDFINFNYPVMIADGNGNTILNQENGLSYINNGFCKYSFVNQGIYYYFVGSGVVWQFVQNNIIADISQDIISFQIQEQSGGTNSINLTISNSNGQWVGPSPTRINFSALWKNNTPNLNSKIYLMLGYYTSLQIGESIPHNIFYIDDITQNNTATANDLVITGRDFNKLLSQIQTAYSYTLDGPDFYVDQFTEQTIGNWNQSSGTWNTITVPATTTNNAFNVFVPSTSSGALSGQTIASLSGFLLRHPNYILSTIAYLPPSSETGAEVDIYPLYIDSTHYWQVKVVANGTNTQTTIVQNQGGSLSSSSVSSGFTVSSANYYPIYIWVTNYTTINVMIGYDVGYGNSPYAFAQNDYNTFSCNLYSFPSGFSSSIALGTNGTFSSTNPLCGFANLKFCQYAPSQNIEELTKKLGTIASVFNYLPENDLVQDFIDSTQWTGLGISLSNRRLQLLDNGYAIQNLYQVSNGEINFDARVSGNITTQNLGFDFVFRNQSTSLLSSGSQYNYKLRFQNYQLSSPTTIISLLINGDLDLGGSITDKVIFSTNSFLSSGIPKSSNSMLFDLSQWHHYKITFNGGWIYAYIDGIMVFSWFDNQNYITTESGPNTLPVTGYWGFSAYDQTGNGFFNNQSVVSIKNIRWPTFWNQINSFTLNPGDDIASAITDNLQTVGGWYFSDLGGRCKMIVLRNTTNPNPITGQSDSVSYSYGDNATNYQLYALGNDSSSKEYVNVVYVIGNGVTATAMNTSSIGLNSIQRIEVITDLQITTESDAQTAANQALINFQKYITQPAPQQIIQVGSEVFDVVNIADTSTPNATGINEDLRIYTQTLQADNKSNFDITIGTGQE
jgi:hypothetical protein